MPCNDNRTQLEEERLHLFLGKDSASEKPWTVYYSPLNSFFSLEKSSPSLALQGLAHGLLWL